MARTHLPTSAFTERLELALRWRGVRKMYCLAVDLGVDESAISRWRNGRPISTDNLVKLSEHLGVSIDWLLTGRGEMAAPEVVASDWTRGFRDAVDAALPSGAAGVSTILRSLAEACHDASRLA